MSDATALPSHRRQRMLARMVNTLLNEDAPTQPIPPVPTDTHGTSAARTPTNHDPGTTRAHRNHTRPMAPTFTQSELTETTVAEGTLSFQIIVIIGQALELGFKSPCIFQTTTTAGPIIWVFDNRMKPPIDIIGMWVTPPPDGTPWPSEWENSAFDKAHHLQGAQPLYTPTVMIASINSAHGMPTMTQVPGHVFPTPRRQD
jgi:hypothetical protein